MDFEKCKGNKNGTHDITISHVKTTSHTGSWGGFLKGHRCCGECSGSLGGCEGNCNNICQNPQIIMVVKFCRLCGMSFGS
jgi:hypothetical protein